MSALPWNGTEQLVIAEQKVGPKPSSVRFKMEALMTTSKATDTRRWLPRFGLRTLFGAITVVCVYLGLWQMTATYGPNKNTRSGSCMPLVVWETTRDFPEPKSPVTTRYYLWLFGIRFTIPFETYTNIMSGFRVFPSADGDEKIAE